MKIKLNALYVKKMPIKVIGIKNNDIVVCNLNNEKDIWTISREVDYKLKRGK